MFETYGTGHVLYAPKQTWVGVDAGGIVRWDWRIGDDGGLRRVPLALEALEAFEETRREQPRGYDSYRLGDRVYCLAWIGQPFDVVAKDDERRRDRDRDSAGMAHVRAGRRLPRDDVPADVASTGTRSGTGPTGRASSISRSSSASSNGIASGEVICGYHVPDGLMVTLGGMKTSLDPKRTMMFRIQALDEGRGQVRVHPVAAVGQRRRAGDLADRWHRRRCLEAIGTDRAAAPRDAPLPLVSHVRRDRPQLGRPGRAVTRSYSR